MDQLAIARRAIEEEISHLSAEVDRLEKVLGHLGDTSTSIAPYAKSVSSPAAAASAKRSPGRPKGIPNAKKAAKSSAGSVSDGDVSSALDIIKSAGKKGIKALSLASLIKKAGGTRPSKEELLGTGKIKMSGRGGGTTYAYAG